LSDAGEVIPTEPQTVSRSRRVLEGVAANYFSLMVTVGVRLLVTPFYLARLGGELLGLNSFVRDIIGYFQVMQLGVGPGVEALVAKELQPGASQEQQATVRKKLRAAGQLQQVVAVLAVLLCCGLAFVIDKLAHGLAPELVLMARICTVLFGLGFALQLSSTVFSGLLVGKQMIGRNTLYSLISKLLVAVIGVVLVALGWSLYGLAVAALISSLFLFAQLRWRSAKIGFSLGLLKRPVEWGSFKPVLSIGSWITVASIGGLLTYQSSRIILGVVPSLGLETVNKFSLLVAVPTMLRSQINRVAALTRPGLTQLAHGTETDRARPVSRLLVKTVGLLASIAGVGIWYVNGGFVVRWVGAQYYCGDRANLLVAALFGTTIWLFIFKMLMEVRFEFRRRSMIQLSAGVLTVALSAALAPTRGIEGVLLAALISETAVVVPLIVIPMLSWLAAGQSIVGTTFSLVSVPLLLLAAAALLSRLDPPRPTSWIGIVLAALVIGGCGLVAGFAWLWRDLKRYRPWQKQKGSSSQ
jgi:O-antigen/teichoic acid export membrane protein